MDVPHVVHLALPGHPLWGAATVRTVSGQNFGLVVAYLLPGFVALWGVSCFSPTVRAWIMASHPKDPTVAGFMYVTLASLGAGMTVSAVRWALIDQIHHATRIKPPVWNSPIWRKSSGLPDTRQYHYRYYQFYSNMFLPQRSRTWRKSSPAVWCRLQFGDKGSVSGFKRFFHRLTRRVAKVLHPNTAVLNSVTSNPRSTAMTNGPTPRWNRSRSLRNKTGSGMCSPRSNDQGR